MHAGITAITELAVEGLTSLPVRPRIVIRARALKRGITIFLTEVATVTAFFPSKGDSPEKFKSFVSTIEAQFATATTL